MNDSMFRLDRAGCLAHVSARLDEPPPGRIQILTGPRQVGKTTLLLELAARWEPRALYAACDGPDAGLPGFWSRVWERGAQLARDHGRAVLLLDEIQHIADWSVRLKAEWDRVRRRRVPLHVVVTGSSALRLGAGARESLAGRFERLTLAHWPAAALSATFGMSPEEAARTYVRAGSYPGAVALLGDPGRWRAYVRDAIIEPAVGRDSLALGVVRRPALFRQVFALAVSLPAQVVSLQKLRGQIGEGTALETVAHYLAVLEETYLIAALEKYSPRALRRRAAPPKLVVLSNAFLAATDPRGAPDPEREPERHGTWVENACLAHAWNAGQRVGYWREEPYEVDGILEGSWGAWAVEVKAGVFDAHDLRGVLEFTRRHPRFRPLVVTRPGGEGVARQIGVPARAWIEFLLEGPPQ
jgi:predicted AAA+ superfamily ATPase